MTDADYMVHIAQCKFEQLICQDTRGIRETKKRMIRKHRSQPHSSSMQDGFMTKTAQARMAMHDLNFLPDDNVPEDREERKHGGEGGFSVYYEKRNMIDFQTISKIPDPCSSLVCMRDDDDFVTTIDEFS